MSLSPEAIRLLRTNWDGKTESLAQELFLMLFGDRDASSGGQFILNQNGGLNSVFNGSPVLPGEPPSALFLPGLFFPEFGSPQVPTTGQGPANDQFQLTTVNRIEMTRTMLPAQVASVGGDGTYSLTLYPDGSSQATDQADGATVLGGGAQALAVGDWCAVYRVTKLGVTQQYRVDLKSGSQALISTRAKVLFRTHDILPPGNSSFPALVTAGGPGAGYTVDVYNQGPAKDPLKAQAATQLQIDPTDTVPAQTWVFVTKVAGNYYFQTPVWAA